MSPPAPPLKPKNTIAVGHQKLQSVTLKPSAHDGKTLQKRPRVSVIQTLNGHEGAAGMIREKVESKAVAWLAYQGELTQWSEPWEHFPSGR